jgi:hypothetical protein
VAPLDCRYCETRQRSGPPFDKRLEFAQGVRLREGQDLQPIQQRAGVALAELLGNPAIAFEAVVRHDQFSSQGHGWKHHRSTSDAALHGLAGRPFRGAFVYPLMTPMGRTRATFFDSPALCTTSTTTSTSL